MRFLSQLLTFWALLCSTLAHPGRDYDDHGHGHKHCEPHPPTTTTKSSRTSSPPASCTFTGTQTFYSSGGCNGLTCETGFCIIDAAATKPCGCDKLVFVTKTTTVCPTKTPCWQCTTGWGTFIETQPCTSTPPPATYARH